MQTARLLNALIVILACFAIGSLSLHALALLVGCAPSSRDTNLIPEHYYEGKRNISLTFDDLDRIVFTEMQYPAEYKAHVFDCSESAAYAEWFLENKGFDTSIVTNRFPTGRHAYVKVTLGNGGVYLINCIPGSTHYYSNHSYYAYIHYDQEFNDIYEACDSWYSEWDWWRM